MILHASSRQLARCALSLKMAACIKYQQTGASRSFSSFLFHSFHFDFDAIKENHSSAQINMACAYLTECHIWPILFMA